MFEEEKYCEKLWVIARNTCPICCVFGFRCVNYISTTSPASPMKGTGDETWTVDWNRDETLGRHEDAWYWMTIGDVREG